VIRLKPVLAQHLLSASSGARPFGHPKEVESRGRQNRGGIPPKNVSKDDVIVLKDLAGVVETCGLCQDKAIEACPRRSNWPVPVCVT